MPQQWLQFCCFHRKKVMFDDKKILVFDDWRAALVGIVVATLWSMILSVIKYARKQGRLALTRSIWKPLLKNKYEITVVLTKKPSDTPGGTSKVSLSEVEAFSALQVTLNPLQLRPTLSHNPNILLKDISGQCDFHRRTEGKQRHSRNTSTGRAEASNDADI